MSVQSILHKALLSVIAVFAIYLLFENESVSPFKKTRELLVPFLKSLV